MRWLAPLLLLLAPLHAQQPLTTAAEVRALPPAEARKHLPVRLRGVVTLFHPPIAFLQDETGAIYFSPGNPFQSIIPKVVPGDFVEIEGETGEGQFAPLVLAPSGLNEPVKVTVLGKAALPEPVSFSLRDKMNLEDHNRYARMRGVVREAGDWGPGTQSSTPVAPQLSFMLSTVDGEVRVAVSESRPEDLARIRGWIGLEVDVHGVRTAAATSDRSLSNVVLAVQSPAGVSVDAAPMREAFAGPPLALRTIAQFRPDVSSARRVQVRGRVALAQPGVGVYLAGDETEPLTGIFLGTTQRDLPPVGSAVVAAGFPRLERGGPVLKDAVLRAAGEAAAVEPVTVTMAEALSGKRHHLLVQLDATLVATASRSGRRVLSLVAEGVNFSAEYAAPGSPNTAPIEPGSRLRVSGICVNEFADERAVEPVSFSLLLRGAESLRVLAGPEFWTAARIATAGGLLLVLLLAASGWAVLLRRRVAEQTQIIGAQMHRATLQDERRRVARELHDTLEQEMTGLALQLASAREFLDGENRPAARSLEMASGMLERSRGEMRMAIWELRDPLLEQGLVGAVRGLPMRFTLPPGVALQIEVEGEPVRLPVATESQLYRIAQEALTNALKHAAAANINVQLVFAPQLVRLEIADDGRGFDADESRAAPRGHFGLLGMRERAEKIGATLAMQSASGQGTRVVVSVPLSAGEKYTLG